MKNRIFALLLLLSAVSSFAFAANHNHYISAVPLGVRLQKGSAGYEAGFSYLGYFWGGNGLEDGSMVEVSTIQLGTGRYIPQRYGTAVRTSGDRRVEGSKVEVPTGAKPFRTIGMHAGINFGSALFADQAYDNLSDYTGTDPWNDMYGVSDPYITQENPQFAVALYAGVSFRQRIIESLFIYENVGFEFGTNMLYGAYADAGLAWTIWNGLFTNAGIKLGFGYSSADGGGGVFEIQPYLGAGWAF